jgi:chromosomal replication initiation ATPase DnaA
MPQYTLPLPLQPVFSQDNFFVADCNRAAFDWVMRWPDWPSHALLLYGPTGAGKTHLGHVWAARAKAKIASGQAAPAPESMQGNWLIEDIETLTDERALFHRLNLAREHKTSLLLTAQTAGKELPFTLPDLTSRLAALPAIGISTPDDAALAAVLRKQFADRQLKVEEDIFTYLVPRMERSFTAAAALVNTIDDAALSERRNITVHFLKRILGY